MHELKKNDKLAHENLELSIEEQKKMRMTIKELETKISEYESKGGESIFRSKTSPRAIKNVMKNQLLT